MIAYSPHADPAEAERLGVRLVASLDAVFATADFVSLHNRLDETTRGLIGDRHLRLMKPTAYFVNVARGGVVDEPALIKALEAGDIAGAGLDVFSEEPLPADNPLWKTKNVTVFPHLGGYSEGYENRAMPTIERNMRCFLGNDLKSMINIVRKPASWGE